MRDWLLSRQGMNGRLEGPYDDDAIRGLLKRGEATYLDFVFDTETREWKSLAQLPQFNMALAARIQTEKPAEWIVLHTSVSGVQSQEGPYTAAMVLERIERGELRYADLVWRTGEGGWTPIFERAELNPRCRPLASDEMSAKSLPEPCAEDLLKNVARIAQPQAPAIPAPQDSEESPWGTDGVDLASPPCLLKLLFAVGLFASLCSMPRSVEAAEEKTRAKVLDFMSLKTNTDHGVLAFQTDASVDEAIKVVIRARAGDVLEVPSYHKVVQVTRQSGEVPSLQLGPLKLPPGRYQVEATVGELRKEKTVNIGVHGEEFERSMARHIKSFSLRQQTEKKALFYSARKFETLAKSLGGGYQQYRRAPARWTAFYKRWNTESRTARKKILELSGSGRGELIYPEEIRSFQTALERLDVEGKTLDDAVRQKREIASDNSSRLTKDFARLKTAVSESRFR